jgi:hypothetical protein
MKTSIITNKYSQVIAIAALLVSAVSFVATPAKAHAFNILDPLNILPSHNILDPLGIVNAISGGNNSSAPATVNYYNTNTNTNTNTNPVTNTNTNTTTGGGTSVPVQQQPIAYNPYPVYPTTPYYPTYPTTYYPSTQLTGSCYSISTSISSGSNVVWSASANGGNGVYTYYWTGTDGFSGYGQSISTVYNNPGTKIANVTISSNGQSITVPCSSSVIVYGYNYNNTYYNPNQYQYNSGYVYTNTNYYSSNLIVACSANTSFAPVGGAVIWTSNVSGGNGSYSYQWTGTDGLYGNGSTISTSYGNAGVKIATLTVYSNGQSISQQCSNSVSVGTQYGTNYNTNYGTTYVGGNSNLTVACAAGATNDPIGAPVTWSVEATGGAAPYSYSWSGSDGLTGSQASIVTAYETSGTKNAQVNVTSADGRTSSAICSNTVFVGNRGNGAAISTPAPVQPVVASSTDNGLSAASLFSLSNIPWGWVAVLVILVLFGVVIYLVFNKNKI